MPLFGGAPPGAGYNMFTTTLADLLKNGFVVIGDIDEGVFDSYNVCDGFAIKAELEPGTWGDVTCIQRILDEPGSEDHLVLLDCHGNSTFVGSAEVMVAVYREISEDELCAC